MNADRQDENGELYTLAPSDLAHYRSRAGGWVRGTKRLGSERPVKKPSETLVPAAPYVAVVRALIAQGRSPTELALASDTSMATIRDLRDGKASVQQSTALKLRRLIALLPEEAS